MIPFLVSFFFACGDSTPLSESPPKLPPKQEAIPDLLVGIAKDGCDNGPGIYGAVDYFYDEFTISGNSVTGTEKWILYPNKKMLPKWQEEGIIESCTVTWKLDGIIKNASRSGDLGIQVVNKIIDNTCPKEIVNKYEDTGKTINYDVQRNDDGTAKFFFSSNGKYVGSGHHKGNQLQFITDKSCRWF